MYREGFINLDAFLLVETHLSSRETKKQLNMQTDLCPNAHFSPTCYFHSVVLFSHGVIHSKNEEKGNRYAV